MYSKLKKCCLDANRMLPQLGLVIYTFGNVSCADRSRGVFAIKPSGVDYNKMSVSDIVVLDFDGKVVEGSLRPSSDAPTHAVLYREFPCIGGIVHTHSAYATAWAQACRSIPIYGTTHADHLPVPVPCTPWMEDERILRDYEYETGLQITDCFKSGGFDPAIVEMVLVGGHGPFTWGRDAAKAVYNARVLEELARMAMLTERVKSDAAELKQSIIDKHFNRKHGKGAYYGQK